MKINKLSIMTLSVLTLLYGCGNNSDSNQQLEDDTSKNDSSLIHNFAEIDLLDGDDGLTPHEVAPLKYGKPILRVDNEGNAIEEHEATISYFNNKYYKYTATWGCGKLVYFSGLIPGVEKNPIKYPIDLSGGKCGIASYSSEDLVNWNYEGFFSPSGLETLVAKPQVHWSKGLKKYVLWYKNSGAELAKTGGLYYAISDTPVGPWSDPQQATGDHLAHDFDIAFDSNGKGYIVTDVFSGVYDTSENSGSKPLWDVWIQALNEDLTGTIGTENSKTKIMGQADFQAIGLFEKDGQWYLTGGPTCGNCEVPIEYVTASSALGRWSNEAGQSGDELKRGTVINQDGCTGQNKGINLLPSATGNIALAAIFGYRTSKSNYTINNKVVHGDNSQAIASTYWLPIEIDEQKRLKPLICSAQIKVPLNRVGNSATSVAYQPDCRIRHDTVLTQSWSDYQVNNGHIKIPVFQRTDDLGPYLQHGGVMDNVLKIHVHYKDGSVQTNIFEPNKISWAPQIVDIALEHKNVQVDQVSLSTEATNGCYGVLVQPKVVESSYSSLKNGITTLSNKAQLFVK